jgi:hypothetical protein
MALDPINLGTGVGTGDGDPLRLALGKANANDSYVESLAKSAAQTAAGKLNAASNLSDVADPVAARTALSAAAAADVAAKLDKTGDASGASVPLINGVAKLGNAVPALDLSRADIPSRTIPLRSFIVGGFAAIGDAGAGARYVRGTSTGPLAIQDAAGTWFNLDLSPHTLQLGWFGVVGDRVVDDTVALQRAVTLLQGRGRRLAVGNLTVRTTATVFVSDSLFFQGNQFRELPRATNTSGGATNPSNADAYTGSIFYADWVRGAATDAIFYNTGERVVFDGVEFQQRQTAIPAANVTGTGWTPIEGPWAVYNACQQYTTQGFGLTLRNCMLRNMTYGVYSEGAARISVQSIRGQCFKVGLDISRAADICQFDDKQIGWTYWTGHADILAYQLANLVAFRFGRVDGLQIGELFAYYSAIACELYTQAATGTQPLAGVAVRAHIKRIYADGCPIGLRYDDAVNVHVDNLTHFSPSGTTGRAVYNRAVFYYPDFSQAGRAPGFGGSHAQIDYLDTGAAVQQAIYSEVPGTIVVNGGWVRGWNTPPNFVYGQASQAASGGFACFDGVTGVSFIVCDGLRIDIASPTPSSDNPLPQGGWGGKLFGTTGATFRGGYSPPGEQPTIELFFGGTIDVNGFAQIATGRSQTNRYLVNDKCYNLNSDGSVVVLPLAFADNDGNFRYTGGTPNTGYAATIKWRLTPRF